MNSIANEDCITYGYSHDDYICQDQSRWMAKLKDETKLSSLSIPGTHDTMSLGWGGDIAQTQSKNLKNQLISGIRFLDIRLSAYPTFKDLLYCQHGFIYLHSTFTDVLNIATDFLIDNPSETIIIRLKQEFTNESDLSFISLLETILNNPKYLNFMYKYTGNLNPTLKELRKKVLLLQNFGGPIKWMLYRSFSIQDNYNLNTNWDLYSKWETVKEHLYLANKSFLKGSSTKFINYLSGSKGVFPYFVASAHSSAETNAPRLLTGLTEPAFKNYYIDFPRVNRLGIFSSISFEGTNDLTFSYINENKPSYVGIIVADFPGQGLINSIIDVNFSKD